MSLAAIGPAARATGAPAFAARAIGWADAREGWARAAERGAPTPFQSAAWLDAWAAATAGAARAFVVEARAADGALAAMLPLALTREGALRVVGFMDGGFTDYNAPLLGPAAPRDRAGARALRRAVRAALPPADLLRLDKMPRLLDGAPNPLMLWPGARAARLEGHALALPEGHAGWVATRGRHFARELERSARVLAKRGGGFRAVRDPAEAAWAMAGLERLQRERRLAAGKPYALDAPVPSALYRGFLTRGLASGEAVLTVLAAGDEVVAALLALRRGGHLAMVRLGAAVGEWTNVSPGRLLIERTMAHVAPGGAPALIDFTIGAYDYKRRFGAEPVALGAVEAALGPLGLPRLAEGAARALARSLRARWLAGRAGGGKDAGGA